MTQANPIIGADKSGLQYRSDDNDGKRALLNHHKGSTAPSYAEAGIIWLDDTATPWALKIHDGTDWIVMGSVNAGTNEFTPYISGAVLGDASQTIKGLVERATDAEVVTGTDTTRYITPKQLADNTGGSGGGLVLLGTLSASASSNIDITSMIDSTYDDYVLRWNNVTFTLAAAPFYIRISEDNGVNWLATSIYGYMYEKIVFDNVNTKVDAGSYPTTLGFLGNQIDFGAGRTFNGECTFRNMNSSNHKSCSYTAEYFDSIAGVDPAKITGSNYFATTNPINAFRLFPPSGTITTGEFYLYGIAKA